MMSKPTTVAAYLKSLPADRREAIEAIRACVLKALPKGYEEGIQYGMIGYYVPHSVYPPGYHCDPKQPLPFASLASQKNHMAVYLGCVYCDPEGKERFVREWKATGKRLDMGASCVRFRKIEDVPLEVLGAAIKRVTVKKYIAFYEASFPAAKRKATTKKVSKKKTSKKKIAKKKVAKKKASTKKVTKKKPVAKKTANRAPARRTTKKKTTKKASAKKRPAKKRTTNMPTTKKR